MVIAIALSVPLIFIVATGLVALAAALGGIGGFNAFKSAAQGWREERDAAVAKADRLEEEMLEMRERIDTLESEVAALRQKDVSKLFDLLERNHNTIVQHDEAVQVRDSLMISLAQQIAYLLEEKNGE